MDIGHDQDSSLASRAAEFVEDSGRFLVYFNSSSTVSPSYALYMLLVISALIYFAMTGLFMLFQYMTVVMRGRHCYLILLYMKGRRHARYFCNNLILKFNILIYW